MIHRHWRLAALLLFVSFATAKAQFSTAITSDDVMRHIRILAQDEWQGRGSGTPGGAAAAAYLEEQLRAFGVAPASADGSYRHTFEFVSAARLGKGNRLAISAKGKSRSLRVNDDFRPLGFSASASFNGPVVFAGYGISLPDRGYDDYAGIDVKGKAVVIMRYSPWGDKPPMEFQASTSLRAKVLKAKEKGASAVVVIIGPADTDTDVPMKLSYDRQAGSADLPVISMRRALVEGWIGDPKQALKILQDSIMSSKQPRSFAFDQITLDLQTDVELVRAKADNVVGMLEGTDPKLNHEIIVIGAHYDHLGMGGEDSGSLRPDTLAPHNGADDNASGTAGVLELAHYFAEPSHRLKRTVYFLAFAGEEMGLLGSSAYVNAPSTPTSRMAAMVNMDMIGRLTDRKLIVYGVGTAAGLDSLVSSKNIDSTFVLKLNKDGFGPSDHSSFYTKKIPVLHFFTDLHGDYHRPSDDWQLINADGTRQVLDMVAEVMRALGDAPGRPVYVQAEMPRPMGGGDGRSSRVYTGTIPDFGEQSEGMKLAGVREGSPSAKAGLQAGDVIIKFGKVDIKNLYDYTYALGEYKVGDSVPVTVRRGDRTLTVTVTLERRN
ncbi:MAG: M20/M25/M40 family metallo-hydrolase [Bacteroidetes bacterium]|jgi:hypothetical protein|nr:M20/M25/M40 family metallo-hydrolase [Bacteroidota bacterium]